MSEKGRKLLAEWEDIRLHEYMDVSGHPTIGVGHLIRYDEERSGRLHIGDRRVPYRDGITREVAMDLLDEDLRWAEQLVDERVNVSLNDDQFAALVSFAFNTGPGNFLNSTLLRVVNKGQFDAVPAQLERWVYSDGRVIEGLKNRRAKEVKLWKGEL